MKNGINALVSPERGLDVLSQSEMNRLRDTSMNGLHEIFRKCSLAVLNCRDEIQYGNVLFEKFKDFDIQVIQQEKGIQLEIVNAPEDAFVDGELILGIKELLFAVLRDVVYVWNEIYANKHLDLNDGAGITNAIFLILRNARILVPGKRPNLVVCWGGHSIERPEYDYSKQVGYELGLRGYDICTGCGPGAMKGPMKGAAIAHAKQRVAHGCYIGLTEPGIIAAEAPNPIVNELVILPDIEKRLEAFVRLGHGIVIFPGGVGTTEEILYLLGILLNPENSGLPFPVILTGDKENEKYFNKVDQFIRETLGSEAANRYRIIIDDPRLVAIEMKKGIKEVTEYRESKGDSFYFNWSLQINKEFQTPFLPTHENMATLELNKQREKHLLAADLRRAFSGIVAGNIKDESIQRIEKHGPFKIKGEPSIKDALDNLLQEFVLQNRMAIMGDDYRPCYEIH